MNPNITHSSQQQPFSVLATLWCPLPERGDMKSVTVLPIHPGVFSQESGGREWAESLITGIQRDGSDLTSHGSSEIV